MDIERRAICSPFFFALILSLMKLKVGDKVRFLDDVGEGVITEITSAIAIVEDEHGFDKKYNLNQLVKASRNEDYSIDNLDALNQKERGPAVDFYKKFNHVKKSKSSDFMEVDLHIENLIDSHRGMDNYQIVQVQMSNFRRSLNLALSRRLKKIVFIHGVGQGVLRNEIREELKEMHPNFEFYDASYHDYGQGATEVLLKYN